MKRRDRFLWMMLLFAISVLAPASPENLAPDGPGRPYILIARGHGGHGGHGHGGKGHTGRHGSSGIRAHGSGHGSSPELKREEVPAQAPTPDMSPKTVEQ